MNMHDTRHWQCTERRIVGAQHLPAAPEPVPILGGSWRPRQGVAFARGPKPIVPLNCRGHRAAVASSRANAAPLRYDARRHPPSGNVQYTSDDLSTFVEGRRYIVYLRPLPKEQGQASSGATWQIMDRHVLTPDGQATNIYGSQALQQLIDELRQVDGQDIPMVQ